MYQYPAGGNGEAPQLLTPPQRLINASRFMYAGAAISAIFFIIGLITNARLRSALRSAPHSLTGGQFNADVGKAVGVVALLIGLWVWMALANRRGRSWARIVATILFGLDTLRLLLSVRQQPHLTVNLLVQILIWLVGLSAIILIWNRESSAYYQTVSATPR